MVVCTSFPELTHMILLLPQISVGLSNSLRSEADAEKHKDLRALLQLLSNLCSKDLVTLFINYYPNQGDY